METIELGTVSALHSGNGSTNDSIISNDSNNECNKEADETELKNVRFWLIFILFMTMGSGANWVFSTALVQEVPYFENHLNSGDCIATYMNAATNISFVAVIVYLIVHHYYPIPHSLSVPSLLFLSAFGSLLAAGTSMDTINGAPVALLISCAIGGIVGGLAGVVMQPFLTYYKTDYISGARAGGSGCMVLTALFAMAQDPGTRSQRFPVSVYFIIFGIILSMALVAYFYIVYAHVGLKDPNVNPLNSNSAASHPLSNQDRPSDISLDNIYSNKNSVNNKEHSSSIGIFNSSRKLGNDLAAKFMDSCIPESLFKRLPWLRVALPYLMTVAWIDFNTWGMLSAVAPIAMFNTSFNGGALNLAIAYEMGSFFLFFGDFSTVYFRLPFFLSLIVFTTFSFTVYVYAAFSNISFDSSTAPSLIAIWTVGRYLEAHMLTSCYRAVAVEVAFEHRESAARSIGLFDQIFTTVGAVLSTALVSTLAKC